MFSMTFQTKKKETSFFSILFAQSGEGEVSRASPAHYACYLPASVPDGPLITLTEGLLSIIHQLSHPHPSSEKCGLLFPCSMWMYGGSGKTRD